ncbi:MAG: hypothetical protein JWR75_624 [Devosia sp.]|nr:hypothetical protein [Devosia sp.]
MTIDARTGAAGRTLAVPMLVLPLTIAATFLSAALLFSVQPMFTKLVLPILGGSSSVWSIAMVFFQALLLLGYGYAHLLGKFAGPRLALPIHLGLMALALISLPIAIPLGVKPPADFEAVWLLGVFTMAVGLPFFALSANGPLLQSWFSQTRHRQAKDPYFLYAASNIGSFASLLLYPVVIEPILSLRQQTSTWMVGFIVLGVLIGVAGWQMLRFARVDAVDAPAPAVIAPSWRQRLSWVGLALVPSGLLVSVTAHISTDVAAVPLLWVVPLALFLFTFVLTFSDRPVLSTTWLARLQVWAIALVFLSFVVKFEIWTNVALHLLAFFISAMVCHTALYARRPPASRLTEFYLLMSLGGCLGGVFTGLIAPQIFETVLEYPILLVAALCCRPGFFADRAGWLKDVARSGAACLVLIAIGYLVPENFAPGSVVRLALVVLFGLVLAFAWKAPRQVAAASIAMALSASVLSFSEVPPLVFRSFFGVNKVLEAEDGRFRLLMHGTTIHGAMRLLADDGAPVSGRPDPLTYYTPAGGMGQAITALRAADGGVLSPVAVIGLGSGSLACHAAATESWRFFEIDPDVVRIAKDPALFRFMSECAPDARIIVGDARLTFAEETGRNALIVLDAFSSDSIPAHLVTAEALRMYLDQLTPHGAIVVHISNRTLDLSAILTRTAAEVGLIAYVRAEGPEVQSYDNYRMRSTVMVLARAPDDLGAIATDGNWTRLVPDMARRPWTDDFSNILEAIIDKARGS